MLAGAAQRAGLARLQLAPLGFQIENAPLLLQQFFPRRDQRLRIPVTLAQQFETRLLLAMPPPTVGQFGVDGGQTRFAAAALAGILLQLLQQVAAGLRLPPVFAQRAFGLALQQRVQTLAGLAFGRAGAVQLGLPAPQMLLRLPLPFAQLGERGLFVSLPVLERGDLFLPLAVAFESFAPGTEALAQLGIPWLFGQLLGQLPVLRVQPPGLLLRRHGDPPGELAGLPQMQADRLAGLAPLGTDLRQIALALLQLLARLLPVPMRRQQRGGRLAGRQPGQLRRGFGQRQAGSSTRLPRLPAAQLRLLQLRAPLAPGLQLALARQQRRLLGGQHGGPLFQGSALPVIQQLDSGGPLLQPFEGHLRLAGMFEHPLGDPPVDVGAGELLQKFGAALRIGLEKGGETALGEQHGAGETREVEAGERLDPRQLVADLVGEDAAVRRGQLDPGHLQRAVGPVTGAALAPEGAVAPALHLEFHLGQALGGVPGHQLVGLLG